MRLPLFVSAALTLAATLPGFTEDRLSAPLARLARKSQQPLGFAVQGGVPVSVTGRIAVEGQGPIQRARRFVAEQAALYSADGRPPDLRIRRSGRVSLGARTLDHVVFHQVSAEVDVYGAELSVLLDGREVVAVGGYLLPAPPPIATRPRVSPAAAVREARRLGVTGPVVGEAHLFLFDRRVFGRGREAERARLVWQLAIGRETLLVDAHEGTLVQRDDGGRGISQQIYDDSADGVPLRFDSTDGGCQSPPCQPHILALADAFSSTFDFYQDRFGWTGYDGDDADHEIYAGAPVTRYRSTIDEEFYFKFGDEVPDIVAHEFTHGVIEHNSDLGHADEPGALNESLSDLFGNLVQDDLLPLGLIGEPGAIRSMCDPEDFFDADHYEDYDPDTSDAVHYNNGIPNRAWCATAEILDETHTKPQIRHELATVGFSLIEGLPSNASMPTAASFAMSGLQNAFGALGGDPWGHACVAWRAWRSVGLTVNGPLSGHCLGTTDDDGDGVLRADDNCPEVDNPGQQDLDGDGIGDACDADQDGDHVPDSQDNCDRASNPGQEDADHDNVGDACEDVDHDGVDDDEDICPGDPDPEQEDADGDETGDACEADNDGDRVDDNDDNCQFTANAGQADTDQDGLGDACDPCVAGADTLIGWAPGNATLGTPPHPVVADSDADGVSDGCDASPFGAITVDGGPAAPDFALQPGRTVRIEATLGPQAPIQVPIDPCPRGCLQYDERAPILLGVSGAPAARVAVIDDRGRVQGKRPRRGQQFRFKPQGGRSYRLLVEGDREGRVSLGVTVSGGE